MSSAEENSSASMGLLSATSIGVGAMIGAGLFALVGIAADIAGPYAIISFIIAGIVTLLTTYSVAKLAVRYPSKGGPVEYLNRAFGRGTLAGGLNVMMWLGYIIVTSLYARAFANYTLALLNMEEQGLWLHLLCSGIVILFVAINFIGASAVGSSELLIVAVKVFVLISFGVFGLLSADVAQITQSHVMDVGDMLLAGGIVFMSYEGFGLVANTAEDIKKPSRNLTRALYFSVLIVIAIYVLVTVAVFGNLTVSHIIEAKEYALAEAAKPIMGAAGFTIMAVAAMFSTASAINATIYGPVHMLQETAEAGQMPAFFTRPLYHHESGVALLVTGVIVILIANTLDLTSIASTGSMIFLVIYAMVNVANLRLRQETGSKAWLIWIAVSATTATFAVLTYYQFTEETLSVYIFGAALAVAFAYQWLRQRRG